MPKGRPPHPATTAALVAHNRARGFDWGSVDWTLPNQIIAAKIGRAVATVAAKRVDLGKSGLAPRMPRNDKGTKKPQCRPPNIEEMQRMATAAAQNSPLSGKRESNIHAKEWVLIAPDGKVYRIRNLYNFVRENAHLFAPVDTIWKRRGGKRGSGGEYCNATAGLLNIKGGKAKSWKGWKLG